MSDFSATDFMFYFFMLFGFIALITTTIVPAALGKKLKAYDFSLQITLPSTIAVLFIGIAFIGLNWNSGDEFRLSLMTIATVVGAMGISLTAIMMSLNRIRWATPN
jgi:hypothetical protein